MIIKKVKVIHQEVHTKYRVESPCCDEMAAKAETFVPYTWKYCAFCGTPVEQIEGEPEIDTIEYE
jgi:hypothetical protein